MGKVALVVDDERSIVKGIKYSLEQDDIMVECAYNGEDAVTMASKRSYDVVILDVMLPAMSGFEVCQKIREFSDVPIIILTAKGEDMDKILGLDYGADDYLTKPFNVLELKARIKAIMRRFAKNNPEEDSMVFGNLKINQEYRRVYIKDKEINITGREYEVLEFLASHPGRIYSRDMLLDAIWDEKFVGDARTVDVHIRRLREKIEENASDPQYVKTKWGSGYYFQMN